MTSYAEIQKDYVTEMRALQPELISWWMKVANLAEINDQPNPDAAMRWPTAFSGHPRVLATFRKYFMLVDDLNFENQENAAEVEEPASSETMWGEDQTSPPISLVRQVDLLIHDIKDIAPDIHKMVSGIIYIPVGLNQFDEAV